jgi:hypothetical protein
MAVASVAVTSREALAALEQEERERVSFEAQRTLFEEARRRARIIQEEAENSEMEEASESGIGALNTRNAERVSIFSYSGPLVVACFKDLLDFSVVLALPGIGTILSFCLNTLIFLLLIFPKRRYRLATNMRLALIDAFILMGLVPLEGIAFPFNLLPFTIAAVGMIYVFDKKFVEKRNAQRFDRKKMKENLTGVIRQAYADRVIPMKYKSDVRDRVREAL